MNQSHKALNSDNFYVTLQVHAVTVLNREQQQREVSHSRKCVLRGSDNKSHVCTDLNCPIDVMLANPKSPQTV
jgi:hypothetical protein